MIKFYDKNDNCQISDIFHRPSVQSRLVQSSPLQSSPIQHLKSV